MVSLKNNFLNKNFFPYLGSSFSGSRLNIICLHTDLLRSRLRNFFGRKTGKISTFSDFVTIGQNSSKFYLFYGFKAHSSVKNCQFENLAAEKNLLIEALPTYFFIHYIKLYSSLQPQAEHCEMFYKLNFKVWDCRVRLLIISWWVWWRLVTAVQSVKYICFLFGRNPHIFDYNKTDMCNKIAMNPAMLVINLY